jgi:putative PIN family toxin of toxin-antitoxin system
MPRKRDKIIVDTNLWISFLLSKKGFGLDNFFINKSITILFSQELLDEFIEVVRRPKLKKYFNIVDLESLLNQINTHAEFVYVTSKSTACRDPKDNFLLSLAIDGNANFLLTGDKDLLELKKIGKTKILTISQYLARKNTSR